MNVEDIRAGFQMYQVVGFNSALSDDQLAALLRAGRTHKEQPLLHLVRAITNPGQNAGTAAWNTEYAVRNIQTRGKPPLVAWLADAVARACDVGDFENATGALVS